MTGPLNGKTTPEPLNPARDVARALVAEYHAHDPIGQSAWDDMSEEEQAQEVQLAENYISMQAQWMQERGWRVVPPGASVIPTSDQEATAMLVAVKTYREAKKRKGGLLVNQKKLILPPGVH